MDRRLVVPLVIMALQLEDGLGLELGGASSGDAAAAAAAVAAVVVVVLLLNMIGTGADTLQWRSQFSIRVDLK